MDSVQFFFFFVQLFQSVWEKNTPGTGRRVVGGLVCACLIVILIVEKLAFHEPAISTLPILQEMPCKVGK